MIMTITNRDLAMWLMGFGVHCLISALGLSKYCYTDTVPTPWGIGPIVALGLVALSYSIICLRRNK